MLHQDGGYIILCIMKQQISLWDLRFSVRRGGLARLVPSQHVGKKRVVVTLLCREEVTRVLGV